MDYSIETERAGKRDNFSVLTVHYAYIFRLFKVAGREYFTRTIVTFSMFIEDIWHAYRFYDIHNNKYECDYMQYKKYKK